MTDINDRIEDYLASGGLFNPELMDHDKARDLLIQARNELVCLQLVNGMVLEDNKKLKYRLSMMKKIRNEKVFEKLIYALEEKEKLYKNLETRDDFLVENGLWNKFIEYTKELDKQ